MTDCPKCRERDSKAANSCETKYKALEAKYQKLVITFAIISGVVGKEIVDKAVNLLTPVEKVISPVSKSTELDTGSSGSLGFARNYPRVYTASNSVLFAEVPPLLPDLGFYNPSNPFPDLYEDYIILPEVGMSPVVGALPFLRKSRKRDG